MSKAESRKKKLSALCDEAFTLSHTCAYWTEKIKSGEAEGSAIDSLVDETRKLNCTVQAIKNLTAGETTDTLAP